MSFGEGISHLSQQMHPRRNSPQVTGGHKEHGRWDNRGHPTGALTWKTSPRGNGPGVSPFCASWVQAFVPGPAASSLPEILPADHKATTASLGGSHPQSQILAEQLHMSTASSLPSPRTQRDPEDKSPAEPENPMREGPGAGTQLP